MELCYYAYMPPTDRNGMQRVPVRWVPVLWIPGTASVSA
jgi:hypothetical protein